MTRELVVYIAGPYRAPSAWAIEQNVRRAEELALEVWRMGHVALCPHSMTRYYQGALPDAVWLEGTLELLRRCDRVLVAEGWGESEGSRVEIAEAHRLGMPVHSRLCEI